MGTDTPAHGHDPCKWRDALRRALAGWQLNVDNHDSRRLILVQEVHLQPEMNAARTPATIGFWRRSSRVVGELLEPRSTCDCRGYQRSAASPRVPSAAHPFIYRGHARARECRSPSSIGFDSMIIAWRSERAVEICGQVASTSWNPLRRSNAAMRRCVATSWRTPAPRASVPTSVTHGYSPATVHQLAAELRAGRSSFFRSSKPGPKGPRKTHTIRDRVLVLRAADHSVTEIAQALTAQGDAVSAQTVWAILKSEGLERLERRGPAGPAPRLEPVTAKALGAWPTGARYDCDHAGLYLLLPAMVELGLDQLIGAANYPGTKVLSSFHSMASLLMLKCSRRGRAGNAFPLGADPGLGLALGLLALPKATHLTSYSYRVRRASNLALLEGLGRQCRQVGLYNGQGGFNLDFHTIRHHGEQVPLEEHYVVSRSQRTRSVLTFFAQDHASTEMVYANADITKAEQAGEVIAFAEYWKRVAGADPGLLVFDSKLTTYPVLDELAARGITFLTLRQRGPKVLEALAALPASAWRTHNVKRVGRYRHPGTYPVEWTQGLAARFVGSFRNGFDTPQFYRRVQGSSSSLRHRGESVSRRCRPQHRCPRDDVR